MQVPVHVWVGECGQELSLVLLFELELLVPSLCLTLAFLNGSLNFLHFEFDLSEVIVSLPALLLVLLTACCGLLGRDDLLLFLLLLLLCGFQIFLLVLLLVTTITTAAD